MNKLIIALAQSASVKGQVAENINRHGQFVAQAAENKAQLVVFPELSLTGYEPELAAELVFSLEDRRLNPLKALAKKYHITLLVGAPHKAEKGIQIGAYLLYPDGSVTLYTKRYLHPGEEKHFIPGDENPFIQLGSEKIAIAVCADLANPQHAQDAANAGSTLYLVSAFITPAGYDTDVDILKGYAQKHAMPVMQCNYSGTSGGIKSAGRSAVWSPNGELIEALEGDGEGLLIVTKKGGEWKGKALPLGSKVQ